MIATIIMMFFIVCLVVVVSMQARKIRIYKLLEKQEHILRIGDQTFIARRVTEVNVTPKLEQR